MNNLRGGHCFGSSRTRRITGGKITFKLGHPVFDGGIRWWMSPLMFLSEWCEYSLAPCLAGKKKLDNSLRLDVVEMARVAWHASFQSLYKKKLAIRHMNRLFFRASLSIPCYDIGEQVGLRTYQHSLVHTKWFQQYKIILCFRLSDAYLQLNFFVSCPNFCHPVTCLKPLSCLSPLR